MMHGQQGRWACRRPHHSWSRLCGDLSDLLLLEPERGQSVRHIRAHHWFGGMLPQSNHTHPFLITQCATS